jgi:hypothetical protein
MFRYINSEMVFKNYLSPVATHVMLAPGVAEIKRIEVSLGK